MFTGLIEDIGAVRKIDKKGNSMSILIQSNLDLTEIRIGDSISVDGVCLTVVQLLSNGFMAEVSPETSQRSNFKEIKEGRRVNLERALRLSDRLGGHLVLGHIDGTGEIRRISKDVNSIRIKISAPQYIMKYIIEKGSVSIDGISLTVNECDENEFGVNIIPHTASRTTLGERKVGDIINIENDIVGKYVERFLRHGQVGKEEDSSINMDFLGKHGFV